jgi:hypothetical protein
MGDIEVEIITLIGNLFLDFETHERRSTNSSPLFGKSSRWLLFGGMLFGTGSVVAYMYSSNKFKAGKYFTSI